jgi:hypothetical protein
MLFPILEHLLAEVLENAEPVDLYEASQKGFVHPVLPI